jgi:hypothetical protein
MTDHVVTTLRIGQTAGVQRSLSGIFFMVAAICLALAAGLWWMKFSVLSPNDSVGATHAILSDDEIRAEVTTVVSAATAGILEADQRELARFVDGILASRAGAAVTGDLIRDAHTRSIGMDPDPVRISGDQMAQIVRDERVAVVDAVTLPVPEISVLRMLRNAVGWLTLGFLATGVISMLAGIVVRPERFDIARGLAELAMAIGTSLILFGYLVPVFVLPALNDTTWSTAVARLALRTLPLVLVTSLILIGIGGLWWLANRDSGPRRPSWNTSNRSSAYQPVRRWS